MKAKRPPKPPQTPALATPWMTPAETCIYFRWVRADGSPSLDMFYQARHRYGLPATKVGGSLRCHRQFVDQWAATGVAVRDPRKRPSTK